MADTINSSPLRLDYQPTVEKKMQCTLVLYVHTVGLVVREEDPSWTYVGVGALNWFASAEFFLNFFCEESGSRTVFWDNGLGE